MIIIIVFLLIVMAMMPMPFVCDTKTKVVKYSVSVYFICVLFTVLGLRYVANLSIDQLRVINHNIGYAGLAGIALVIIVSVLDVIIKKNKDCVKLANIFLALDKE